jgi:hypothetical protein
MKYPIGTILRITKVICMHALWDVGCWGVVTEYGIFTRFERRGYKYIPEEQYLFEEV